MLGVCMSGVSWTAFVFLYWFPTVDVNAPQLGRISVDVHRCAVPGCLAMPRATAMWLLSLLQWFIDLIRKVSFLKNVLGDEPHAASPSQKTKTQLLRLLCFILSTEQGPPPPPTPRLCNSFSGDEVRSQAALLGLDSTWTSRLHGKEKHNFDQQRNSPHFTFSFKPNPNWSQLEKFGK